MASCYPSSRYSTELSHCVEHEVGYIEGSERSEYTALDSGTAAGMSGGGLFTRKDQKLIGINVAGTSSCRYSNVCCDRNIFVLFTKHQTFLINTMDELKRSRKF